MEFPGISPLELLCTFMIALIILGPSDMVKAGKSLGRFMRKIVTSPESRAVQQASQELNYLHNRFLKEANFVNLTNELIGSSSLLHKERRYLK